MIGGFSYGPINIQALGERVVAKCNRFTHVRDKPFTKNFLLKLK